MDMLIDTNYYMGFSQALAIPGVSNLAPVWRDYETKTNQGSGIVYITKKVAHQHAQNATFGLFAAARLFRENN